MLSYCVGNCVKSYVSLDFFYLTGKTATVELCSLGVETFPIVSSFHLETSILPNRVYKE